MKADDLENINPEVIRQFIENGENEGLTDEQEFYLHILKTIQQLMTGQCNDEPGIKSKNFIVKYLVKAYPGQISEYQAGNYYADAINFFYIDKDIKLEAWGNYYAERLENLALATMEAATCTKDFEIAHKIYLSAMEARTKYRPEEATFPEELFKRPIKIYKQDPRLLNGQEPINRNQLAKIIDEWDIPEAEKARLRVDAAVETPKLILPTADEDSE